MGSEYSRKKIVEAFQTKWLAETRKKLLTLLEADAQKLKVLLENTLKHVKSGERDKGFQALIDQLKPNEPDKEGDTQDHETPLQWVQQIQPIIKEIPKQVILEQEEQRFKGDSSNSVFIKSGKFIKRAARGYQNGLYNIRNRFGNISEPDSKTVPVWTQTIPLQGIIAVNLLDFNRWMRDWNHQFRKLEAELLLEFEMRNLYSGGLRHLREKNDGSSGEEVSTKKASEESEHKSYEEDTEVFFQKTIEKIDEVRKSQLNSLEELTGKIIYSVVEAISVTDTIERDADEYSEDKVVQKEWQVSLETREVKSIWNKLKIVLANRVTLSLDFIRLHSQAQERVEGFRQSLEEFFGANLAVHNNKLMEMLEEAIGIFDKAEEHSLKEVQVLSTEHREKMNEFIEQNLLSLLDEYTENATLSRKLERFTSAIPEWTKELPEKAVLIEELDLEADPPIYEFEEVEWRALVQRVISNHLAKEFMPKEVKLEQFLEEIRQGLKEISQIIYTNLEIVDEVEKSDGEDPGYVVREGLSRAKTKLQEISERIDERRDGLTLKLTEKTESAFLKLAMLLEKQDVTEVRLAGAEYKAKETAVDWKTKLQVQWANTEEKTELFARFIWKKIKQYFSLARRLLGFAEKEKMEGDKTDLATFLSETDEQIEQLPFIYRRLFDFHKEVDERFYIRRSEQFNRLKKGYELWQNNFPSTFAIVGEKGSGKSLFIRLLMGEVLTKSEVIEINFEDTIWKPEHVIEKVSNGLKLDDISTIDELIDAIGRKKKRIVVILENVQNCYIRNISGYEAIEHLMFLISETNKNILWITSSTRYGWLFLDKVLNVADYFTHMVQTDNLNSDQIEDLILKRHRASGYQLKFLPDETTKKARSYRKLMDDEEKTQEFLQKKYFERLSKLAEGNPSIAMIFWIRSIKEHDDSHFYIAPFEFGAINRIDELESPELFALAAFVLHDSLMPNELSEILHQPLRDSKVMVSRLTSSNIIYKTEHGFVLNHLIYRQVVRVLKEANFIH
ncbi:MAG: hypothetical protein HUJ22_07615 [Gracilimonas sp.]|uniref:hypothetical protein n=1 Tax=Gracilimonas sp. TaxID=1974203 RepID=UPI0019B144EF|nr:hypothetical protein [Gracilimonas sp.]MBD3616425.1 hypothetical protein [Gracilimonas sp.]